MEQQSAKTPVDFRAKLRSYWKRRYTFLIVSAATFVVAILMAFLLPPTYRSMATILIEQQEIPQEFVRSIITSFADQRVQMISQRVMTTQNLLSLIERYNLYPEVRQRQPREVLLQTMRDDISMKMISADVIDPRSGRPTQATIAFSVAYQNRSADLALKVANDLTTLYLNENVTTRTQLGQQTTAFFGEEAAREAAHIAELDNKLATFKKEHPDNLPELSQLNIQLMERTQEDLRDAENRIGALDSQRVLLDAQLAEINPNSQVYTDTGQRVFGTDERLKSLKTQLASLKARYAPTHPDIITAEREVAGLEKETKAQDSGADLQRQLADAKAKLADASQKYSPEHPDVLRLKRQIESLEKAVAASLAAGAQTVDASHADNPVYVHVKSELDSLTVERQSALRRRDELRAKFADYEKRLSQSPEVERQFNTMARDLQSAQMKYQEILAKQTEAQVSQNLETERKGERFELIEPPQPPETPISPNRLLIVGVGIVLSLFFGIVAAAVKDALDTTVRGAADIRQLLHIPALASIPMIVTREDLERHRMIVGYSWAGSAAALLVGLAGVHFFIAPLDVVWQSLMHRFGA